MQISFISSAIAATAETGAEAAHDVAFYANPSFWVGVAFFLVIALAARKVYAAIGAGLDARAEKIKARIEESIRLREDAQEMLATYERKQRDAMKEAEDIIAHAKAEALRLQEQSARDLDEAVKRREKQAMDRIAQAEAQALAEVRNQAVEIAMSATRKLISDSMSAQQSASLIDQAINELPAKLH